MNLVLYRDYSLRSYVDVGYYCYYFNDPNTIHFLNPGWKQQATVLTSICGGGHPHMTKPVSQTEIRL